MCPTLDLAYLLKHVVQRCFIKKVIEMVFKLTVFSGIRVFVGLRSIEWTGRLLADQLCMEKLMETHRSDL